MSQVSRFICSLAWKIALTTQICRERQKTPRLIARVCAFRGLSWKEREREWKKCLFCHFLWGKREHKKNTQFSWLFKAAAFAQFARGNCEGATWVLAYPRFYCHEWQSRDFLSPLCGRRLEVRTGWPRREGVGEEEAFSREGTRSPVTL